MILSENQKITLKLYKSKKYATSIIALALSLKKYFSENKFLKLRTVLHELFINSVEHSHTEALYIKIIVKIDLTGVEFIFINAGTFPENFKKSLTINFNRKNFKNNLINSKRKKGLFISKIYSDALKIANRLGTTVITAQFKFDNIAINRQNSY